MIILFPVQLSSSLRAKLQKAKEKAKTEEEKDELEEGKKVPETNRISNSYQDRFKIKDIPIKSDDVTRFLPKDYPKVTPSPSYSADIPNLYFSLKYFFCQGASLFLPGRQQ